MSTICLVVFGNCSRKDVVEISLRSSAGQGEYLLTRETQSKTLLVYGTRVAEN